jgi:hypothetical protein
MGGQSFSPNGKTGSPGKHYARWSCEIADENKPLFKGKTYSRELLAGLQELDLYDTRITAEGVKELRKAMPKATIHR